MRSDSILIIPDIHQDIDFLTRCLRLGVENRVGEEMRENFEFYALNDLSILTVDVLMEPDTETGRRPIDLWGEHAVLAVERFGWLITHAGVHPSLWPQGKDLSEGITELNETMRALVADPPTDYSHPLIGAGPARGGYHPVGGPLWLDFVEEFVDDLPFPQVVGHTRSPDVLQNGRSLCLDACQQVCALLHPDGTLEPRICGKHEG